MGTSWYSEAACKNVKTEVFYPIALHDGANLDARGNPHHKVWVTARNICADCPVTEPCLEVALQEPTQDGMRAGTTPDERRAILIGRGRGDRRWRIERAS